MLDKIAEINGAVNGVVWGIPGHVLLIGTGILMTLLTKVFQVSKVRHWWKMTIGSLFKKDVIGHSKEKGSISRLFVLLLLLPLVPVILQVLPLLFVSVVPALFSGCGLQLSLV